MPAGIAAARSAVEELASSVRVPPRATRLSCDAGKVLGADLP
jgi:hypothetical protein